MTCAAMTSTQVLLPARKDAPYDPASDFLAVLRSAVTTIEAALADGDWDADRETGAAIGRTLSFLRRTPAGSRLDHSPR